MVEADADGALLLKATSPWKARVGTGAAGLDPETLGATGTYSFTFTFARFARTLAAAPIGLRGTLEPSTSPAIRACSPAPEPPALESPNSPLLPLALALACTGPSTVLCHSALDASTHHRSPRCRRIPRRSATRLAHQLQLSFSTAEPGLLSGRPPSAQAVVALLRSPKPAH